MSKCISNWGEFSEHEYTGENATCDYCGQVSEMIAVDQLHTMRAALVAIQELHPRVDIEEFFNTPDGGSDSRVIWVCGTCEEPEGNGYQEYPCATRRLADDALTARTTKNGDNK